MLHSGDAVGKERRIEGERQERHAGHAAIFSFCRFPPMSSYVATQLPPQDGSGHKKPRPAARDRAEVFRLARGLVSEGGLSGGQTGDGHAVRRAGHVGEADLVTERHRLGISTVFATDAELGTCPWWFG